MVSGVKNTGITARGSTFSDSLPQQRVRTRSHRTGLDRPQSGHHVSPPYCSRHTDNEAGSRRTGSARQRRGSHIPSASSSDTPFPSSKATRATADGPADKLFVSIKTQIVLESTGGAGAQPDDLDRVLIGIASHHNGKVPKIHPRMEAFLSGDEWAPGADDFSRWIIAEEASLRPANLKDGGWGIELTSPKFAVSDSSNWKASIMETWKSFVTTVELDKGFRGSTQVHISMIPGAPTGAAGGPGMGLQNMKRIAQCAIHFEPALEVLGLQNSPPTTLAASNWIDNKNFAYPGITRQVAMQMIETCDTEDKLTDLMCPGPQGGFWAWNIQTMRTSGTIEFRNKNAALGGHQAIAWGEFVVLFVQAAVRVTPSSLSVVPANIRGLKEFLGFDKLQDVKSLLIGRKADDFLQPVPLLQRNQAEREMLKRKLEADDERQRRVGLAVSFVDLALGRDL